jgi:two-component system sensor histidine kinase PilS (NtrC family)
MISGPSRLRPVLERLRPVYDGPNNWLWIVGAARLGVLVVVAVGANLLTQGQPRGFALLLNLIYAGALASSAWYFLSLLREQRIPPHTTWIQMLVDFSVVSATISFTGGQQSFYTFLLVIVILEAGVMMGLVQGFLFATLALTVMFIQTIYAAAAAPDLIAHWYNFLIQGISYFFTAFISGYWNARVSRMKQFQREILDNMNSGFLITDNKGLIVAINRAGCAILRLVEGDVAGLHVDGIIRPESGAECPITTALRLNRDFASYEFTAEVGRGESILLGLTTNRIHDINGNVTGLIATFTDLTEMARMRQELQQQDRLAVIGELAAGLAHEIRNPVASIRGAMDELRGNLDAPQVVQRLAAIAIRESDHLNQIVTGFLDFARNPSRRRERVDLCAVARETREQILRAHPRGLKVTLKTPPSPCFVSADPTQIRQVFSNLAQNAVEAMEARGELSITVEGGRNPVEVRFEDRGPGIPPDKVARIFEPFYTEKTGGVGMGLAICLRIVTAHDGTLRASARPGGGTTMTLRLPAAAE